MRPIVISITGYSGAGKSALASAICSELTTLGIRTHVIHMDCFYDPTVTDPLRFDDPSSIIWDQICSELDWLEETALAHPQRSLPQVIIYEGIFPLPRTVDISLHIHLPFSVAYTRRTQTGLRHPGIPYDHLRAMARRHIRPTHAHSMNKVCGLSSIDDIAPRIAIHIRNIHTVYLGAEEAVENYLQATSGNEE